MILAGAYVFTYLMALTMIPMNLSMYIFGLALSKYAIQAIILISYLILGCFLDATSMMVLTLPVIFPTIFKLGFNPIWFGVIFVLMIEAATPWVEYICYFRCGRGSHRNRFQRGHLFPVCHICSGRSGGCLSPDCIVFTGNNGMKNFIVV